MENREIKFQAFQESETLTTPLSSNYALARFFTMLYEDTPIREFTGLVHNGTEVYTGDIIKNTTGGILQVYFDKNEYGYYVFKSTKIGNERYALGKYMRMLKKAQVDFKVIGNIYQNPELLK